MGAGATCPRALSEVAVQTVLSNMLGVDCPAAAVMAARHVCTVPDRGPPMQTHSTRTGRRQRQPLARETNGRNRRQQSQTASRVPETCTPHGIGSKLPIRARASNVCASCWTLLQHGSTPWSVSSGVPSGRFRSVQTAGHDGCRATPSGLVPIDCDDGRVVDSSTGCSMALLRIRACVQVLVGDGLTQIRSPAIPKRLTHLLVRSRRLAKSISSGGEEQISSFGFHDCGAVGRSTSPWA